VRWSPDRLARTEAHQWLLSEALAKLHMQPVVLHQPFGDTPQGKLLPPRHGMIAADDRAPMLERTRRGRREKARRGACIPWASSGDGSRAGPKRRGAPPQAMLAPAEAAVGQAMDRARGEDHLSGRQIARRLHASPTPAPAGKKPVGPPAPVGSILPHRVYAGAARDRDRHPGVPRDRTRVTAQRPALKTGRSDRPEADRVWSDAPAMLAAELFADAQVPWPREAALARTTSPPTARRDSRRRLVTGGAWGVGMGCRRPQRVGKKYAELDDEGRGHAPLTCGRLPPCPARRGRADRLEAVVWPARSQF
jgi:site-specific DNA recombinase